MAPSGMLPCNTASGCSSCAQDGTLDAAAAREALSEVMRASMLASASKQKPQCPERTLARNLLPSRRCSETGLYPLR